MKYVAELINTENKDKGVPSKPISQKEEKLILSRTLSSKDIKLSRAPSQKFNLKSGSQRVHHTHHIENKIPEEENDNKEEKNIPQKKSKRASR